MTYEIPGLQERAATYGCEILADHEALTLLLSLRFGKAASDHARALLQQFHSLPAVLGAPIAALSRIVSKASALELKLIHDASRRVAFESVARRPVMSSWSALLAYVKVALAHETREQFRVLFLDKKNQLIADEKMNQGTVDHAPVYPREILRRALELDASAIILVRNHPSGDPTPSSADIDMTRQVVDAAKALRIAVHDHLIVGRDGVNSLKTLGVM